MTVSFSRKTLGNIKIRLEKEKNPDYWIKKIERNRTRGWENDKKLLFLGYTVIHFRGDDIPKHTAECLQTIEEAIRDSHPEPFFNDELRQSLASQPAFCPSFSG